MAKRRLKGRGGGGERRFQAPPKRAWVGDGGLVAGGRGLRVDLPPGSHGSPR